MDSWDLVMEGQAYHVHQNAILRNPVTHKKGAKCVPVRSSKGKGKACAEALFQDPGFSLAAASGPPNLQGS